MQLGKMLDAARNTGEPKPYLGNRAVQWGRIDVSAAGVVPMTRADMHRYRLRQGDLLVCEGGEVGRAAIWQNQLAECYFQKALHRLRPKGGFDVRLMLAFLEYWANTGAFANYVTQTSIAHLPRDKFISMPLPFPSPSEQRRLGELFDDLNGLATALQRLMAKKRAIKQGLMQQLLTGKTRLPGYRETWNEARLGDHASMSSGGTPPSGVAKYYGGGIPWVSISDMTRAGRFVHATEKTLSADGLAHCTAKLYPEGAVLYAMYASLGECAIAMGRVSSSQAILGIVPGRDLHRDYLYYCLTAMKAQVREMGQQGTQANLNATMVRDLRILLPPLDEQEAIAKVLSDADDELDHLRVRLDKERAVRTGVMQELLTGRTQLSGGTEDAK
ncbi:hypothetical protein ALMP_76140 [Streptomyces sp. A012304]|nr:hypothetical protein ALMP_76140 [Streptomyces sp. A012304]